MVFGFKEAKDVCFKQLTIILLSVLDPQKVSHETYETENHFHFSIDRYK